MTLDEIVQRLDQAPKRTNLVVRRITPDGIESEYAPGNISSWRGSYEHPTMERGPRAVTALGYAKYLRSKRGLTMVGYKGGTYPIQGASHLWADPYGEADGYAVSGLWMENGRAIMLVTQSVIDW